MHLRNVASGILHKLYNKTNDSNKSRYTFNFFSNMIGKIFIMLLLLLIKIVKLKYDLFYI